MSLSPEQVSYLKKIAEEVAQGVDDIYELDLDLNGLMRDKSYHGFFSSAPNWVQDIAKKNKNYDMIGLLLNVLVSHDNRSMKDALMKEFEGTIKVLDARPRGAEKFLVDMHADAFRAILDIVEEIKTQKKRHESSDEYVDSPMGGPLGRTAFSKKRLDDAPRNEPNTRAEQEIYDDLSDYVIMNAPLKDDSGKVVQDLISGGKYPKIFKSPATGRVVYRGMIVTEEWLEAALGMKEDELIASGEKETSFMYTPQYGSSSSWSREKKAAERFSDRARAGKFSVILYASSSDNPGSFLDLNDGLYNVSPMRRFSNEEEVLGIGNIKVFKIEWRKST